MRYITTISGKDYLVEIIDDTHVAINGTQYEVDFNSLDNQPVYSLLLNGDSHEAIVYPLENMWQILLRGKLYTASVEDERERRLRSAGSTKVADGVEYLLKSPMPGLVVGVTVNEGQVVNKGDLLIVLESMKMQNELRSPRKGSVARIRVKNGDSVEQRQTLLSVV